MPEIITALPEEVQFSVALAKSIRKVALPVYGIKQRDVPINEISKDYNYTLDIIAENAIRDSYASSWRQRKMYGYATEDQGLMLPPGGSATHIQMIDPVDGSRPAQIGAEMACVQIVGVTGNKVEATFEDIEFGVTYAIKENRIFLAEKGKGAFEVSGSWLNHLKPRKNVSDQLKDATMVYETYSMSSEYTGKVIDPLLRELSFETRYPSGSYSALTVVRGQNELHVDLRRRLMLDYPELTIAYKPNSKSLFPMDVAAGWLMIRELGGLVTDAYGNPLDNKRLWEFNIDGSWSENNQISWVAGITSELHAQAMAKIEEGFARLLK